MGCKRLILLYIKHVLSLSTISISIEEALKSTRSSDVDSVAMKDSSPSAAVSSRIETLKLCSVAPGAKVNNPAADV